MMEHVIDGELIRLKDLVRVSPFVRDDDVGATHFASPSSAYMNTLIDRYNEEQEKHENG